MNGEVEWTVELAVKPGQAGRVQALLDEMVAATRRDEPGARHYEFFGDPAGGHVTVVERYADTAAAEIHMGNFNARFAERFGTIFQPGRCIIYGPASVALRAALADLNPIHAERIAGFAR